MSAMRLVYLLNGQRLRFLDKISFSATLVCLMRMAVFFCVVTDVYQRQLHSCTSC